MNSRSPYSHDDESDGRRRRRSPSSRQDSTSTQTYTTKKNMKDDQDMARTERGRTRNNWDGSPDIDKSSDSYYSDGSENIIYGSNASPTSSAKTLSPRAKKSGYKVRSVTPVHNSGRKKVNTKFSTNKKAPRWGFRSQSLNKESPPKDMDVVTKRILSARLLKINELKNELTEAHMKLEDSQKETKALKRLQFRQEKALNKFEDTENEVSQLISQHNNEMRTLKERLRKSQERERFTEKRLKDTEEELYRANVALKKLKQLSENRHLAEREELTKKVDLLESRMDDRERRVRELEKNIELTQSSFQRQLIAEKKKVHDVQEENKVLQESLKQLTQKLRDKERELEAKNIYAFRLSKPSPKKDTEITPRKKKMSHSINTGVQTKEDALWMDFPSPPPPPPPPPPPVLTEDKLEIEQKVLEEDNLAKQLKEEAERIKREKQEAERLKKEREQAERKQAEEEMLNRNREQKLLEDKAKKLRAEWEKEEFERKRKDLLNEEKKEEERLRKDLLLAKMFEIDHENKDPFYSENSRAAETPPVNTSKKMETDTKHKTYIFSEPTEKLFNGLPVQGGRESKSNVQSAKNTGDISGDITFGSYAPSFGIGRSTVHNQRKEVLEEPIITTSKLDLEKDKKSTLMEQLFGNSSNAALPSISEFGDQNGLVSNNLRIPDQNSSKTLPWEKNSKIKGKDDVLLSSDGKISSSSRSRLQNGLGRTTLKAVNSVEDEIEELTL